MAFKKASFPKPSQAVAFYGNPWNDQAKFEREKLVMIKPPFVVYYAGKPVRGIRVHYKCAESFSIILSALWKYYGENQAAIDAAHVSIYNGCFNVRPIRNGKAPSMHSFGAAIDFDAANNGLTYNRDAGFFKPNSPIVTIFKECGWFWGGDFKGRRDPMHFEAVSR